MPAFLEKFVLPLFAATVILLVWTNPMGFDTTQRITGAATIIFAAFFVGHTLTKPAAKKSDLESEQSDSKKPPTSPSTQQSSQGANSPNTSIVGNQNVVGNNNRITYPINSTDPKVISKLDEIKKLIQEQQGTKAEPDELLKKYPIGYVIFDIDKRNDVFPYATQPLLDQWDFDWTAVKVGEEKSNNQDLVVITLPNISPKSGHGVHFQGTSIGAPLVVGPLGFIIWRSATFDMKAEILSIRPEGIVFLLGFTRIS